MVLTCYGAGGTVKTISQDTDLHGCLSFQESFPHCWPHCLEWKYPPGKREVVETLYLSMKTSGYSRLTLSLKKKTNLNLLAELTNGKLWFLALQSYDLCGLSLYLCKDTNSLPPC